MLVIMNKRNLVSKIMFVCALLVTGVTAYAEMIGNLYRIDQDSISFGGGASSSTNYGLDGAVGPLVVGDASSTNYSSKSGYPLYADPYISVTDAADVNLGSMTGMPNDELSGTAEWQVSTNNPIGYVATLRSDTSPSLQRTDGAASFPDYTPTTSDPDLDFVDPLNTNAFGFTVDGSDVVQRYRDDGTFCNNPGADVSIERCWDGLSITPVVVAQSSVPNMSGVKTKATFRMRVGSNSTAQPGTYQATVYFAVTAQF